MKWTIREWTLSCSNALKILKIIWPYVISNDKILKRTKLRRIGEKVKIRRWKWIGQVLRMEGNSNCITELTWKPKGRRKANTVVGLEILEQNQTSCQKQRERERYHFNLMGQSDR